MLREFAQCRSVLYLTYPKSKKPEIVVQMIQPESTHPVDTQELKDAGTIEEDPRLHDMRCFFEVARQKNAARAAKKLNMEQSDLLCAIESLETAIGTRLVDLERSGSPLTEAGETFHRYAAPGVAQVDHATSLLKTRDSKSNHIMLGALPNISERLLPRIIARYKSEYPEVTVSIVPGINKDLLGRLRDGELNLVLGILADADALRGLHFERLYAEPIVFVTRCDHPLAKWHVFDYTELTRYPVSLPHADTVVRVEADRYLAARCLTGFVDRIETASYEFARAYAQECDCILIAPLGAVQSDIDRGCLVRLPVGDDQLSCPVGITTDPSRQRTKAQKELLGMIREVSPSY